MLVIVTQSKLNRVNILYGDSATDETWFDRINSSVLQNMQTGCGSHISPYSIGTARFVQGSDGRGLNLATDLYLAPK